MEKEGTIYHGAGGYVSINNPTVGNGQMSCSAISIEGGGDNDFSVIRVGWMVNLLYHGDETRLYTAWGQIKNGKMHGCLNTECAGFVQTDPTIGLDMILKPYSVVRGPQYYVKLAVNRDKSTGNWWLLYGENDKPVGYWPSKLFLNLKNGAATLRWGGLVNSATPQMPIMGNGDNGELHSSHFRQIAIKYEAQTTLNGTIDVPIGVIENKCYKAGDNSYKTEFWGYSFYFGGNGGDVSQCS
ncbi:hypothetical protein COLO4_37839 [Corchorus olitorius]|uniref:Neprosin PEP catalytic domain-containing protein n=1 Tax=Corchorus olitorius TaxID=93759 RepID=A0A1R3FYY0_9ROSI|nr:hypothetical protein COLO4_37839 [Corchorus olitorius]